MLTKTSRVLSLAFCCALVSPALARTVRYGEVPAKDLETILSGKSDATVAFRKGDAIPVRLKASGDLIATEPGGSVTVRVQRDFYLRSDGEDLLISTDGVDFAPLKDKVTGQLKAGAGSDGLEVDLAAFLRP